MELQKINGCKLKHLNSKNQQKKFIAFMGLVGMCLIHFGGKSTHMLLR